MKAINIFIADDSKIHLEGLKIMLYPYNQIIKIVGEATNCSNALMEISKNIPNVAILDINLEKEMDGIDLAIQLKKDFPLIKIIFLTYNKEIKYLFSALKAGADAYLSKDLNISELLHSITTVMQGNGLYLGETIPIANLLEIYGSKTNILNNKIQNLSKREIEIIELFAKGYSTKEIAKILNIEPATIESHKERIKEKLNVKSVVQIVVDAIKKGIIKLESL